MLLRLFLLFTLVPLLELTVLIKVGTIIGTMNTIMLILLTGISGAVLAKSQGIAVLSKIQIDLQHGRLPAEELLNGVFILAGGLLLLTPGLITDLFGFILLIPISRDLCKKWLRHKLEEKITSGNVSVEWWKP